MEKLQEHFFSEPFLPKRSHRSTYFRLLIRTIFRSYQWILTHRFYSFILICFLFPSILYCLLLGCSHTSLLVPQSLANKSHRVLLIVAHPDDECLFFAPSLRALFRQYHYSLSAIVFSRGNHKGLGQIRAEELLGSCDALQIPKERCLALDLPHMQDNPKVWWPQEEIINTIKEYVQVWSIDFLVTFDHYGISGHINHRALSAAVHSITRNNTFPNIQRSYELHSVSLLRKYWGLIDFYLIFVSYLPRLLRSILFHFDPFNLISPIDASRLLLINTPHDYFVSRTAFASHATQYSWDRHLYLIASRYMYVNELKAIERIAQ